MTAATHSITHARLPLRTLMREAEVRPWRVAASIGAGTMALGSAVGLAAVAAWLIAQAAQMPSPAELSLAAVIVRFFGIARGLFRYLERLVSHETALSGVVALRTRTYERVAHSGASHILSLKRGDIVARIGGDIDAMGDAVVRSLVPLGVAASVSLIAVAITAWYLPVAALALAACLLAAAVLAAVLTWKSAKVAAEQGTAAAARVSTATLEAIDGAIENRVWGRTQAAHAELRAADADAEDAAEAAARPAAWAAGALQAAQGTALVLALVIAVTASENTGLSPMSAAVVALLPLAAFEAVSAVPGAVVQAFKSAAAARRVLEVAPHLDAAEHAAEPHSAVTAAPTLTLDALSAAWPAMTPTPPISVEIAPGGALGIVGRTGAGKTTVLLTIAGALAPASGRAALDGVAAGPQTLGSVVSMTPEDAHVFGTTVLENLRVARGDVSESDAENALDRVGLGAWLANQPQGVHTLLGAGGHTVSGGERRRLLLARALLAPAPIHLIDEPAEHLDADGVDALKSLVRAMREAGRSVVIVTHDLGILDVVDEVISLDDV